MDEPDVFVMKGEDLNAALADAALGDDTALREEHERRLAWVRGRLERAGLPPSDSDEVE